MHDLTLKPGRETTEWVMLRASFVIQWATVILTVLTDVAPVVPEKYKPWVLLGVALTTSLQSVAYSVKRNDLKTAAVEAVTGYNLAMAQIDAIQGAESNAETLDPVPPAL